MQKAKTKQQYWDAGPILLDTHTVIWLAEGNAKLEKSRAILQTAHEADRLTMSAISAWEVSMLVTKSRLTLSKSPLLWIEEFVATFGVLIIDVTAQIAIESNSLPGDFHGDPADRMIVATAKQYDSTLMTADKAIIAYSKTGAFKTLAI